MSEEYNIEISKHYAAYRPPIHGKILEEVLTGETKFTTGLDIGCGTGVSTEALGLYCHKTVGVDPSKEMLSQAKSSTSLTYLLGTGENLSIDDETIDIVTFAGSLSYARSDALVSELVRVCRSSALIIAYDFEVQWLVHMKQLGIEIQQASHGYDHAANFSSEEALVELNVHRGKLTLQLTSEQLAHVLFSSQRRYSALVERFGSENTFTIVVGALDALSSTHDVAVDTYYSMYTVKEV